MKKTFTFILLFTLLLTACDKPDIEEKDKTPETVSLTDALTDDMYVPLDGAFTCTEMAYPEYFSEVPPNFPPGYEEYYEMRLIPQYSPAHGRVMIDYSYDAANHIMLYDDPIGEYELVKAAITSEGLKDGNVNFSVLDSLLLTNGNILYIAAPLTGDSDVSKLVLKDTDGGVVKSVMLDGVRFANLSSAAELADDGRIVVLDGFRLHVFDKDLTHLYTAEADGTGNSLDRFTRLFECENGDIYVKVSPNVMLYKLDDAKQTLEKIASYGASADVFVDRSGIVYTSNGDGVYKDKEMILDWELTMLDPSDVEVTDILDGDTIIIRNSDPFTGQSLPAVLKRSPDADAIKRVPLKLALCGIGGELVDCAVAYFNRTNDTYHITTVDLNKQANAVDGTTAKDVFDKEIANGAKYDLVMLSPQMANELSMYTNKDYFADLAPYVRTSGVSLISSVKSAYSISDKMFHIPVCFTLNTLAAIEGTADGKLTTEAMYELLAASSGTISNTELFDIFVSIYDFIDYDSLTCTFDSDEFVTLLGAIRDSAKYADTEIGTLSNPGKYAENIGDAVKSGGLKFQMLRLSNTDNYAAAKLLSGKSLTLCGYPSDNYTGARCSVPFTFGIVNDSAVKAGAWKFIETMLGERIQTSELVNSAALPVTESGVDALLEYDEFYVTVTSGRSGNILVQRFKGELPDDHPSAGQPHVLITDAEKAELRRLLCESKLTPTEDSTLESIVREEYTQFRAGDITAEEAADRIQSRVSIYLSERYG